jgi:hypothetical protein
MSKKPYMYEHLEWLEIFQRKDWNDPTVNPDDLAEYSEFGRPYAQPDGEDTYWGWEHTWPTINFPDIPPLIKPDPVESPCNIEDSCTAIGIAGPAEMECEDCYTYTHAHVILTCEPAWWMAFGSWTLDPQGTECYLLFSGPIMATVCCPGDSQGTISLTYEGPLECSDSIEIAVSCEGCCLDFEITGAPTVNPGSQWTGTITPACPTATCEVSSNSGCTIGCGMNDAGSEVYVTPGVDDCGGFTVTVTDQEECEDGAPSDSFGVRINNAGEPPHGDWVQQDVCTIGDTHECNRPFSGTCYKHGATINSNCTVELTKYISARQDCSSNMPGQGCLTAGGCVPDGCPTSCGGSPCAGEPPNTRPCQCSGGGQSGWFWNLTTYFWICECA